MMKIRKRGVFAGLAVAVVVCAWVAAWWHGRADRVLRAAEEALAAGEPATALEWLSVAESGAATRSKALLLKARATIEMGSPANSVEALNSIDPDGPLAAEVAFWKGRALLAARQSLQAMNWFQRSLEKHPQDPETLRWLAVAAYDQGAVPLAVNSLTEVTRIQPTDARAWRTLGMIHKEYKRFEQAIPVYEKTLELDPNQALVRLEYAECLIARGGFEEAAKQLDLREGSVDEAKRSFLLASAYQGNGDEAKFATFIRERSERFPSHAGLSSLRGALEIHDGRPQDAIPWLDRAVAADPWSAEHYHRRGVARAMLGQSEEGAKDNRKAAELNDAIRRLTELDNQASQHPDDARIRCQLGQLCALLGKFEMAASWYRAALACNPSDAEARWGLHQLRSRLSTP